MAKTYRNLTGVQIEVLTGQGCQCPDWSRIKAADGFDPKRVKNTKFSGDVKIGSFDGGITFFGGVTKSSGITNATIHNCVIGDNVYIDQIGSYIANYVIEDNVVIENVDLLAVEGQSSFGNGVKIAVLNEAGGREVAMYDNLSAQTAYILALYRHRPAMIEKVTAMIYDYARSVTCDMGTIGKGTRIINCRVLQNVKTGPCATIEGVNRLVNGSINSSAGDPVYIGPGVSGEDFIVCSGAKVSDGALIVKCFVGQGCELSKQYSAENSVFFANCAGFHGEACSIFAGPHTVTHHKSTLLIAGLFSFLNAGSGSNQSNHMYKLGPVHQGVVERGSKTTSDSYMLWPARIGAFTLIMGRHYSNPDTSDLPYSYLIEHENESILVPAANLKSVGTVRDAVKWPKRDKRKDPHQLDLINYNLLSPYTAGKMLKAAAVLKELEKNSGESGEYYLYNGVKIKRASVKNGLALYEAAIVKYLGNCLVNKLAALELNSTQELGEALKSDTDFGKAKWIDLAGMFAPQEIIEKMLDDIERGEIATLEALDNSFRVVHQSYLKYEWAWALDLLEHRLGKKAADISPDNIIAITQDWKAAVTAIDEMFYKDAGKEYAAKSQAGFGIDGDEIVRQKDFAAVRGNFEENSFTVEIRKHIETKSKLGDKLIAKMQRIKKN